MQLLKKFFAAQKERYLKNIPFHDERRIPSEMVENLHIQTEFEHIVIKPTDGNEIIVLLHGQAGEWYENHKLSAEMIEGTTLRIQITKLKRKYFLDRFYPLFISLSQLKLEIMLPKQKYLRVFMNGTYSNIDVTNIFTEELCVQSSQGNIHVGHINAEIQTTSHFGEIHLNDIKGRLSVHSLTGDIYLENAHACIDVNTDDGEVKCRSVTEILVIATDSGDIFLEDVVADTSISTSYGNVDWKTGGGKIEIDTETGDIHLSNLEGVIEVTTESGILDFKNIQGQLNIDTDCGDIELVEMIGTLKINTDSGDLKLRHIHGGITIDTDIGDIELCMDTIIEDVNIYTDCGQTTVVLNQEPKHLTVKLETDTGDIQENLPNLYFKKPKMDSLHGLIGEGGPVLSITTDSSDIELRLRQAK